MSTATCEPPLGTGYKVAVPETGEISRDEWVYADPEAKRRQGVDSADRTDEAKIGVAKTDDLATGTQEPPPLKMPQPVRRDEIVAKPSGRRVRLLQQWECIVQEVNEETITCEMHDLTNDANPTEFAEVDIDSFSPFDKELLQEGAVFYWSVTSETTRSGQVSNGSIFRVRRMPPLSRRRIKEIQREAARIHGILSDRLRSTE